MKIRNAVMVLAAMCATALIAPVAASAAAPTTTATSFKNVPVTGKAHNGKSFNGHFTVTRFISRNGKTYAQGTLTGKLGSRNVKSTQVAIPAKIPAASTTTMSGHAAATCPILHLTLGPLDLNLLGLTVHLNQVVLNIDAVSGPGNLLGNLLCSLSNLLNSGSPLSNTLTGVLNIVQQLLNNSALLNL
jgi:hypothetical protein